MVKTYLRYVHEEAFGIVSSSRAPTVVDSSGKFAFSPGIHEVLVWDLKRGEQVRYMTPDGEGYLKGEVTSLLLAGPSTLAVGYSNGMVRCFDAHKGGAPTVSLMGHKGAVVCLGAGDVELGGEGAIGGAMLLASGGNDTDVVVWDLVAERGVCRLKGHKDAVTAVRFLAASSSSTLSPSASSALVAGGDDAHHRQTRLLASCSKDALVKLWDLDSQHCVQTIVGHRAEVWGLAVDPLGRRLVSGTNDERLRVWALPLGTDKKGNDAGGEGGETGGDDGDAAAASRSGVKRRDVVASFMGSVARSSATDRCVSLQFHTQAPPPGALGSASGAMLTLLGAQSSGKLVDVFRVRSEADSVKKLKRRLKRHREKAAAHKEKRRSAKAAAGAAVAAAAGVLAVVEDDDVDHEDEEEEDEEGAALREAAEPGGVASSLLVASDELELCGTMRSSEKVVSFAFLPTPPSSAAAVAHAQAAAKLEGGAAAVAARVMVRLLLSLATNSLEVHEFSIQTSSSSAVAAPSAAPVKLLRLELPGHRTDPKCVGFSSGSGDGDEMVASAASGSLKVWSKNSKKCIRSIDDLESTALSAVQVTATTGAAGTAAKTTTTTTAACLKWLPGDRFVVVGTKEGSLLVCDLASGSVGFRHDGAHGNGAGAGAAVHSLDVSPDGQQLASGGADSCVKLWDIDQDAELDCFALADEDDEDEDDGDEGGDSGEGAEAAAESSVKRRGCALVHAKTLQMGDDVLCVKYSPNARDPAKALLCVATLDSTVRVYFKDTLKFFLQLYGHKLPVGAMDVSGDCTLIATGSADKTLKLWGLDFGDCHRSLLAHKDAVTAVVFVKRTHYLFTCSKDRTIKYWDADHFEQILVLDGHAGDVWSLCVSEDGSSVCSVGKDRTLRMWTRTDEPVFLEEEREREMMAGGVGAADMGRAYEMNTTALEGRGGDDEEDDFALDGDASGSSGSSGKGRGGVTVFGGDEQEGGSSGRATRSTLESLKGGERLMEALEVADAEAKALDEWDKINRITLVQSSSALALASASALAPPPPPQASKKPANPMLLGLDPDRFVLWVLRSIKRPDLEEALLVLPFHLVERLVARLANLLRRRLDPELSTRVAVFCVRLHHASLSSSGRTQGLLRELQTHARTASGAVRDSAGTNLAGLKLLKRSLDSDDVAVASLPEEALTAASGFGGRAPAGAKGGGKEERRQGGGSSKGGHKKKKEKRGAK